MTTQPTTRLSVATTAYECGTVVRYPFGMERPKIVYTGDAMKKHALAEARKNHRMKLLKLPAGVIIEMASEKLKEGRG